MSSLRVVPALEPLNLLVDHLVLLALEVRLSSQLLHIQLRQLHYAALSILSKSYFYIIAVQSTLPNQSSAFNSDRLWTLLHGSF